MVQKCIDASVGYTEITSSQKERQLPRVFSREDIVKIIEGASTFKHQVLLTFIYVTGVRLSEAIHMRIDDGRKSQADPHRQRKGRQGPLCPDSGCLAGTTADILFARATGGVPV